MATTEDVDARLDALELTHEEAFFLLGSLTLIDPDSLSKALDNLERFRARQANT